MTPGEWLGVIWCVCALALLLVGPVLVHNGAKLRAAWREARKPPR